MKSWNEMVTTPLERKSLNFFLWGYQKYFLALNGCKTLKINGLINNILA